MKKKLATKKSILLVVEGQVEQLYFHHMRSHYRNAAIEILPKLSSDSSPFHVIDCALTEHKKKKYDYIWCVYDTDVLKRNKPADFDKKYNQAVKANIRFADSFPCFELWLLAHFELPNRDLDTDDRVVTRLCRHIDGYCKKIQWHSQHDLFNMLLPQLETAMKNAGTLEQKYTQQESSVYTKMYHLIKMISDNS